MRLVLLITLALAFLPAAGAAQRAASALEAPIRESGVTLTVSAYLRPSPTGQLMLPLAILDRLAAEPALLAIDTEPVGGYVVIQVRFGFPDAATFRRWYTDGRNGQLLEDLRATTMDGTFATMVTLRTAAP